MPTFRQYTLRFMVHEARGEREMATRMMELMLRMRNSKKRQAQVTVMGFNYFITIDDKKRAKELLSDVKQRCDQAVAADCQLTYDIMCGKRHDYIERMEGMLDSADPALKSKLYLLIAKQYRNAGDTKSAKKYEQMLDDLAKEFEFSMPQPGSGEKGRHCAGGQEGRLGRRHRARLKRPSALLEIRCPHAIEHRVFEQLVVTSYHSQAVTADGPEPRERKRTVHL